MSYKIVRAFSEKPKHCKGQHLDYFLRTIKKGLTLEEAQAHCRDPETDSRTATGARARRISRRYPKYNWVDTYDKVKK